MNNQNFSYIKYTTLLLRKDVYLSRLNPSNHTNTNNRPSSYISFSNVTKQWILHDGGTVYLQARPTASKSCLKNLNILSLRQSDKWARTKCGSLWWLGTDQFNMKLWNLQIKNYLTVYSQFSIITRLKIDFLLPPLNRIVRNDQ